jgi:hypothetical protein
MDAILDTRVMELEAALAAERAARAADAERIVVLVRERDQLRASHEQLRIELEMLKRRIFVAKAERVDTTQLEMEFAQKLRQLDALAGTLPNLPTDPLVQGVTTPPADRAGEPSGKPTPTGRRDLKKLPLEEERIEIADPLYEELIAKGLAKRIDFEESCQFVYKRGGLRRLVIARVKYQVQDARGDTTDGMNRLRPVHPWRPHKRERLASRRQRKLPTPPRAQRHKWLPEGWGPKGGQSCGR